MKTQTQTQTAVIGADAVAALAITSAQARKLGMLADAVIQSLASAGEKYLNLCTFIREAKLLPKVVAAHLADKGFSRSTISKINSVAAAPARQWNEYAARRLGFNRVLELKSAHVAEVIAGESGKPLIEVQAQVKRLDLADHRNASKAGATNGNGNGDDWEVRLETAASAALKAAAGSGLNRVRVFREGGYSLTIRKETS